MRKVFSERWRKESEAAEGSGTASHDRLAQGFELLFGSQLQAYREAMEGIQTDLRERLDALQQEATRQAERIEQLGDKAQAAIEREQDEYRRRRGVEAELRMTLSQIREMVNTSISELQEKTSRIDSRIQEQVEAQRSHQREVDEERYQLVFLHLEQALAKLEASKLDRSEVATLLTTAVRSLGTQADD